MDNGPCIKKIAVGLSVKGKIDPASPLDIQETLSECLNKDISKLCIKVLDKERHQKLINGIRQLGARVLLITDGDLLSAIATCIPNSGVDALIGRGASAEGVLAAIAMKILGGEIFLEWAPRTQEDLVQIMSSDYSLDKFHTTQEIVKADPCTFVATAIADCGLIKGIEEPAPGIFRTYTWVIRSETKTSRIISAIHNQNNQIKLAI